MAMLLSAMFIGPDYRWAIALLGFVGCCVGFLWMRHITRFDEDTDLSFWRYRGERTHVGLKPTSIRFSLPTRRWIVTRTELAIAFACLALTLAGPLVLPNWQIGVRAPFIELVWPGAIVSAAAGTAWMLRIARRGPEDGPSPWPHRR